MLPTNVRVVRSSTLAIRPGTSDRSFAKRLEILSILDFLYLEKFPLRKLDIKVKSIVHLQLFVLQSLELYQGYTQLK